MPQGGGAPEKKRMGGRPRRARTGILPRAGSAIFAKWDTTIRSQRPDANLEGTMSGPPPTPLHLRVLRGNPGSRPCRAEPEPAALPEAPEPPVFLIGHAADEWHRVAGELHALGVLRG